MALRYSSRRQPLDQSFLNQRLIGAKSYDRIAGYFSSSILEVAGEALESISGPIRVVCNSDLDPKDVETARAANLAMRREWCASEPEKLNHENTPKRFRRLFEFLRSGKMQVKVLPSEKFGLVHGKAGVVTMADGRRTSFLGSTNETFAAWKLNYELVWEDDSREAVEWVQEEFDALWTCPAAVALADFVIEDIGRLARRTVIPGVAEWRESPEAAAPVIETPVYRREYGLWEHQKYFVNLAFEAHRGPHGARFVLADQVGLGKTIQLALSAMLIALYGDKPILVLAPKPLLWQWQDEMKTLLDMPSAVWTGKAWVDENGIEHPVASVEGVRRCPRRVGLISQGLITRDSDVADILKDLNFECVIVDECHRARRRNLGPNREGEKPDPNNLLRFLYAISPRTKSLLLATATPVQMYPVEAWDLLNALAVGNEPVLGNQWRSLWRHAECALDMVMVKRSLPEDEDEGWDWMRNPLPPATESNDFLLIRRALRLPDEQCVATPEALRSLSAPDLARIRRVGKVFVERHNPFIRHIVRRTREFLENTIDPETGEPYLKPVRVELFGEDDEEAVKLPPYLRDAYHKAEEFCEMLSHRMQAGGFLKTLLLRRIGSSIEAGMNTANKLLGEWQDAEEEGDDSDEAGDPLKTLTSGERQKLKDLLDSLEANRERDPKFEVVLDLLKNRHWLNLGCIVFSQYFDSVWWLANLLSAEFPDELIGIYAGSQKSGVIRQGKFNRKDREDLKAMVRRNEIRLLLGTDAASEGLNLQRLGTLINLDLPWNPTRLEQRKGRIQRIGQLRDTVYVYNMRYKDSVEDRVHHLLSSRLQSIYQLFGQIPDVLEDVWIDVALGKIESAKKTINALPEQHPFEIKYDRIEKAPWEACTKVLDEGSRREALLRRWH